jgi:hypothetical protein
MLYLRLHIERPSDSGDTVPPSAPRVAAICLLNKRRSDYPRFGDQISDYDSERE